MEITDFLDKAGVSYQSSQHHAAFSAQTMAAAEHEPGRFVAKPVIIKADGKFLMCVLPACFNIDLDNLRYQLGAESLELASEKELAGIFSDCQLGAEPPFGNLYNLPTIMDVSLEEDNHIMFQAGTHEDAIRMYLADYVKLAEPKILDFSYHPSF